MENKNNKFIDTSHWIDSGKLKREREEDRSFYVFSSTKGLATTTTKNRKQSVNNLCSTIPVREPFTDVGNKSSTLSVKRERRNSFDEIPARSPPYKYKRGPCRKKVERARLPGQCCDNCHWYYNDLRTSGRYTEEEVQDMKNKISRHRDKYPIRSNTPPGFWNPTFSDSN